MNTKLLLKNKQPLPQLPVHGAKSEENVIGQMSPRSLLLDLDLIPAGEDKELNSFESGSQANQQSSRDSKWSGGLNSTSYSESSLDGKSFSYKKSQENILNQDHYQNRHHHQHHHQPLSSQSHQRSSSKKRVNIRTDEKVPCRTTSLMSSPKYSAHSRSFYELEIETCDEGEAGNVTGAARKCEENEIEAETSMLQVRDNSSSLDGFNYRKSMENCNPGYLTMTGTIKRGRKKGQSIDLQLNISRDELERINTMAVSLELKRNTRSLCCQCSRTIGPHILLLSLMCWPLITFIACVYSFYIGTLTWYNMFNYLHEEKSLLVRFIMSPILVITYPLAIVMCTVGLGLYAGLIQISLQYSTWSNEVADIEKGFYGWLCSLLNLSQCSPYETVILTEIRNEPLPYSKDSSHSMLQSSSIQEELSL